MKVTQIGWARQVDDIWSFTEGLSQYFDPSKGWTPVYIETPGSAELEGLLNGTQKESV